MPVDKAEIEGLVERLRQATGPDRRIDASLYRLDRPDEAANSPWPVWIKSQENGRDDFKAVPRYTASIDAAMALVERRLAGERVAFEKFPDHGFCVVKANSDDEHDAEAPTLPLAILAALLTALGASK